MSEWLGGVMVEIRVIYALISGIQGGIFEKTCEQVLISGVGGCR